MQLSSYTLLKRVYSTGLSGRGCLFLDRDGVINERRKGGYVTAWDEFIFRPGAIEAMHHASLHIPIVVVSNQRCIARALASTADVEAVMNRMCDELHQRDVNIAAWYVCPHDTDDRCGCRKPRAGMLLQAEADLNINIESSFMVGDSLSDVAAGHAAGCAMSVQCDPAEPRSLQQAIEHVVRKRVYAG